MSESRITPGVIYKAVLLAFGLVVAAMIFQALTTLILGVLIVVTIAAPLTAIADFLARWHVPRAIGATLGLLVGLAAIGGLVALIVPVFTREVNHFVDQLPQTGDLLSHRLGRLTGSSPAHISGQIQHFINNYTHNPSKLLGPAAVVGESVAAGVAAIIVVLLTSLYTAIHPDPLVGGIIRLFPVPRRQHVHHILMRLRTAYLAWLRGLFVGMVVLGGLTYIGLLVVGLHFAAFFAVFTAVAMIVPYFGALASSIPPILYALTISPQKAILVAIIYIGAHQLESNVIQPLVVARTVKLHPAVVAIGVVAVDQLFGFIGLLIAVPITSSARPTTSRSTPKSWGSGPRTPRRIGSASARIRTSRARPRRAARTRMTPLRPGPQAARTTRTDPVPVGTGSYPLSFEIRPLTPVCSGSRGIAVSARPAVSFWRSVIHSPLGVRRIAPTRTPVSSWSPPPSSTVRSGSPPSDSVTISWIRGASKPSTFWSLSVAAIAARARPISTLLAM